MNSLEIRKAPTMTIIVMVDVSDAMAGEKIRKLSSIINDGIVKLFNSNEDCLFDITIISYNDCSNVVGRFESSEDCYRIDFMTGSLSYKGKALCYALRIIEDIKAEYKRRKISYLMPWIIFISDGTSSDDTYEVINLMKKEMANNNLGVYAIGYEDCDWNLLKEVTIGHFIDKADDFDLYQTVERCLEEDYRIEALKNH